MKRFLAIGVLALCLMSSQIVRADEKSDAKIKAQMVENYLLWQEAWKLADAERMISFESPDFMMVSKDGTKTTKEIFDDSLRIGLKQIRKVYSADIEIKKLSIENKRVVVVNQQYLDAHFTGEKGEARRATLILLRKDTWVEYDRIFMLKRTEDLDWKFISHQ